LEVEILTVHEFLMFFGEMSFGHGPAFALLLTVDALFKPVGDQGALARSGLVVGIHLGGIVAEH
jgi:hypothetical protein